VSGVRNFLLGLLAGVLVVVLGAGALLLSASRPTGAAPPAPQQSAPPAPLPPPANLRKGETWLQSVDLSSTAVVTPDGPFSDVRANGTDVLVTAQGLRVGHLRLEATLPFAAAARQIDGGVELYAAGDGRAGVRRTASLAGRAVTLRATGTVAAVGGQLVIEPETVDLGGPDFLDAALSAAARRLVTIRHTVEGLPEGMRLTRVTVSDHGFRATLEGSNVTLAS
jgi:hypothetical protein